MVNSNPDDAQSQVHNIIDKIEHKLMMRDNSRNVQYQSHQSHQHNNHHHRQHHQHQQQLQHYHHQSMLQPSPIPSSFTRFKPLHTFANTSTPNDSNTFHNYRTNANDSGIDTNFDASKCEPKLYNNRNRMQRSLSANNCSGAVASMSPMPAQVPMQLQMQFNPYADENDNSNRKFQLSKSVQATKNAIETNGSDVQHVRCFGNDRTNLIAAERQFQPVSQMSTNSPSVINLRKENFHSFNISNNMIVKNPSTIAYAFNATHQPNEPNGIVGQHQHFANQNDQENQVMFRTYDLNDDYWLNFE